MLTTTTDTAPRTAPTTILSSLERLAQDGTPRATAPAPDAAETALARALELLERGRPTAADRLLTAALLVHPGEAELWLAAGIARLERGAWRSARAALTMCGWQTDDPYAAALLEISSSRS